MRIPFGLAFKLAVSSACLLAACGSPTPQSSSSVPAAADQTGLTAKPVVSINAVMVDLVDHAAHHLWAVEPEGKAPKTDEDWDVVAEHAVQIAAAGPAITVGGTGPSDAIWVKAPQWHEYAQRMSGAGVAALQATKTRDFKALVEANGQLAESCEGCHQAFKPALPTEGITHAHRH